MKCPRAAAHPAQMIIGHSMGQIKNNKYKHMKLTIILLMIGMVFCFAKCEKDKLDFNGLPQATQEGKNTFGFLLNGQPWTPNGSEGIANLSADVDFGFKDGIFNITAYRIVNREASTRQSIGLGVSDSLNFFKIPITLSLGQQNLFGLTLIDRAGCTYDFYDPNVVKAGELTITKLDRTKRIISGMFNATPTKNGCQTLNISDGRFDMKF